MHKKLGMVAYFQNLSSPVVRLKNLQKLSGKLASKEADNTGAGEEVIKNSQVFQKC